MQLQHAGKAPAKLSTAAVLHYFEQHSLPGLAVDTAARLPAY
jgi:hypothetical protein